MNLLRNSIFSRIKKIEKIILFIAISLVSIQNCYSQTFYVSDLPKLAAWEFGTSNETIIILHGGPAVEHSYLRPEWDTLSSVSKIFYYDQRGCGKSDTARSYTWIDHVNDLKKIKDTISKNKKIVLAGSSWGAELALLYSIYFPEDIKAIILSGFCGWNGRNTKKIDLDNYNVDSLYSFKRKEIISNYEDSIRNSKAINYKDFFKRVRENVNPDDKLQKRIASNFDISARTKRSLKSAPGLSYLDKINIPILAFGGNLKCTYQDWSDVIQELNENTKRVIINNSCHDPWFSHTSEFFQECFKFIESLNIVQ